MIHLHSNKLRAIRLALPIGALSVIAAYGCSSSSSSGSFTMTTEDSGTPPAQDAASAVDSGGGGDDSSTTGTTTSLPFFVSDQFIPSGFMNDPTGITLSS